MSYTPNTTVSNNMSNIIAICYIATDKDEKNKCYLTDDKLYINRKGKESSYNLENIIGIIFKRKRLLLPLVSGAIIGLLFLIAGFNFLINIWLAMVVGAFGLLVSYYGWVGSYVLAVCTKVKEYDVFISNISPNLRAFVAMINEYYILDKGKTMRLYYGITKKAWSQSVTIGKMSVPSNGILLHTQIGDAKGEVVLSVKPTAIPNAVNYHLDPSNGKLKSYLMGDIDVKNVSVVS